MIVTLTMLAATPCGSTVTLEPGRYDSVQLKNKDCSAKPLTIIASGSKIERLNLTNVKGVVWRSGTFSGAMGSGKNGYAISVNNCDGVTLDRIAVSFSQRGVVIGNSQNIAVNRSTFTRLVIDGINIALSHKVRIAGNSFTAFDSGKAHPDAIQAWSRPTGAPTSDIVVEDNVIDGQMQGIFFGNHVRNGVNDGGFDRVTIRRNVIRSHYTNGIALHDCRACTVEGNSIATLPTSPNWSILVVRGGSVKQWANVVEARRVK